MIQGSLLEYYITETLFISLKHYKVTSHVSFEASMAAKVN
jgi:hypothetical protein